MSALAQWSQVDTVDNMTDVGLHIQQTNDRLQCIQQQLLTASTFHNAARELLEWCSDTRAFQWQFEQRLMGCLTVVSQVAAQFGYDLDLGYRLLAVCAAHRDKLSPKSAGLLSVWCEELGRLLLLRHQKDLNSTAAPETSSANNSVQIQPMMQSNLMPQNGVHEHRQWQQLNAYNQQQSMQKNSAISSAPWSSTQAAPLTGTFANQTGRGSVASNGGLGSYSQYQVSSHQMVQGNGYMRYPAQIPPASGYVTPLSATNNGGFCGGTQPTLSGSMYRQQLNGYMPNSVAQPGCSPGGIVPGMPCPTGGSTSPDPRCISTPSASMSNEEQMHHGMTCCQYVPSQVGSNVCAGQPYASPPYGNCYQTHCQQGLHRPQQGPILESSMRIGSNKVAPSYVGQRRPTPYPSAQQYVQSKRSSYPVAAQQPAMPQSPFYNGQMYSQMSSQYGWSGERPPSNYVATPAMLRPAGSPAFCSQSSYMQPGNQCRPSSMGYSSQFNGMNNYQQQQPIQSNNFSSGIFDNLTPPMTPAAMTPYSSSSAASPTKQPVQTPKNNSDDLRLTFPVRDGIVLPPFRLEHNLAVSNHVFHLRESVFQTLMWRSDLELQLKCFHHEDQQMSTNWPASVTVSVNATPLAIDRADSRSLHRPLYLKDVCQQGRNTIQITVTACCCSHLFVLQLVHRPSINSVLHGLLRKRLLPAEHCITKIKRSFTTQATVGALGVKEESIEQTAIKISLKCPITYRSIVLPVRGHDCKHIQCFDLDAYLRLNCERGMWRCPICNKPALLEGLEIDHYIWAILQSLSGTQFEEVTIDTTASWKPVPIKASKEEDNKDHLAQKWLNATSPSSMTLPSINAWQEMNGPASNPPGPSFPLSPQVQSFYANPNGGQFIEGGPNPCFPSSGTPDFLSSLSQMGDNLLCSTPGICISEKNGQQQSPADGQSGQVIGHSAGQSHLESGFPGHNNCPHRDSPNKIQSTSKPATPAMNFGNPRTPSTSCSSGIGKNSAGSAGCNVSVDCKTSSESLSKSVPDFASLDFGFDPSSSMVDENESQNREVLDLLPDNFGDPSELLSYLGPSNNVCNGDSNNANNNDDLLSLFS